MIWNVVEVFVLNSLLCNLGVLGTVLGLGLRNNYWFLLFANEVKFKKM